MPPLLIALLAAAATDSSHVIRVNQVGYLPDAPKSAVYCSVADSVMPKVFVVRDER